MDPDPETWRERESECVAYAWDNCTCPRPAVAFLSNASQERGIYLAWWAMEDADSRQAWSRQPRALRHGQLVLCGPWRQRTRGRNSEQAGRRHQIRHGSVVTPATGNSSNINSSNSSGGDGSSSGSGNDRSSAIGPCPGVALWARRASMQAKRVEARLAASCPLNRQMRRVMQSSRGVGWPESHLEADRRWSVRCKGGRRGDASAG